MASLGDCVKENLIEKFEKKNTFLCNTLAPTVLETISTKRNKFQEIVNFNLICQNSKKNY